MTQQTINELRRLEREATRGEWKSGASPGYVYAYGSVDTYEGPVSSSILKAFPTSSTDLDGRRWETSGDRDANAELVIAMRNSLIPLLDELESLRNQKRCTCPTHQRGCELMIVRGDRHSPDET